MLSSSGGNPMSTAATEPASGLGRISAFIICRDEKTMLGACLDSLEGIGEIVLVDSGSTDGSLALIADYQANGWPIRLIHRDWSGFAAQKQFALDQCARTWCLGLDCDERLSEDLRRTIAGLALDRAGPSAYAFARLDWLPGYGYAPRWVHRHYHTRLFRKDAARYDLSVLLHEGLLLAGKATPVSAGPLLHFRNLSVGDEFEKANRYATLKARQKFAAGERAGLVRMVLRPLWRLFKSYVLQRYFLCGVPGFVYAAMLGIYVFLTEAKLHRLQAGTGVPDEQ